jgi:hypothetical protein
VVGKTDTFNCQLVEMRGEDELLAIGAEFGVAQIVGIDIYDIGGSRFLRLRKEAAAA